MDSRRFLNKSEIEERHQRTRALMEERGLDALFLSEENNLRYYTGAGLPSGGLGGFDKHLSFAVLIPRQGDAITIVPRGGEEFFRSQLLVGAIVSSDLSVTSSPDFVGLLRSYRTVGVEAGLEQRVGVPISWLEDLGRQVQLVDSEPITSAVRAIKSRYEIECIRDACRATATAFGVVYDELAEGLSERDIEIMLKRKMVAAGADDVNFANTRIYPGAIQGARQKGRVTKPGDYVWSDVGSIVQGYRSDFSRASVIGPPARVRCEILETYEAIRVSSRRCVEAVRAGMTAADVCALANAELAKFGFPPKAAGRVGHGIGLDTSEIPSIALNDSTMLQSGMVFTIEPGYMADHGYYVVESIVLVTESEPEVLSDVIIDDRLFGL